MKTTAFLLFLVTSTLAAQERTVRGVMQPRPGVPAKDVEVAVHSVPVDRRTILGSCDSDALVAVYKGMARDGRMHERSDFRSEMRIKVLSVERHHGACHSRLQRTLVSNATRPSKRFDLRFVEVKNLSE